MNSKLTRRGLLLRGLQYTGGACLLSGLTACSGDEEALLVCADLSAMTSAQESVRRTLNYSEQSTDPARLCSGCEFFTGADGNGGCGSCAIFDGGPVNPGGHCDSWSVDS